MSNNPNALASPSFECSVCYDDRPSADFDISQINREVMCECFQKDTEKRLCVSCCRHLLNGENKCPFCRRLNFLRNTRISSSSLIASSFNFGFSFPRMTNEAYNALSGALRDEYRQRYLNFCFEYNEELYAHITQLPESEMPTSFKIYMFVYRNGIQQIVDNVNDALSVEARNWFIADNDYNLLHADPIDFRPSRGGNMLSEGMYIYMRDTETEEGYQRFAFSSYTESETREYAHEYISNNVIYMNRTFILEHIASEEVKQALRLNNTQLWETIQGDDTFQELIYALIDREEMVDTITSGMSDIEDYALFGIAEDEHIESSSITILGETYRTFLYIA